MKREYVDPAWLTDALRALVPDDFMLAPVVQQLDASARRGGRGEGGIEQLNADDDSAASVPATPARSQPRSDSVA
jgi:hypothetical protein